MSLIIKTLANRIVLLAVLLFCLSTVLAPAKTSASIVYKGPCSSDEGNFQITPAFEKDGKSYDCVREVNVNNGDIINGGTSCDVPGVGSFPGYDTAFGRACLVPKNVSVGDPPEKPKYVANDCNDAHLNASNCGIVKYLLIAINVLSGAVGIVIVLMIIVGGIEYTTSADDPQKVQAAKTKITNALLALFLFIFMFALLQYLVPGGIF